MRDINMLFFKFLKLFKVVFKVLEALFDFFLYTDWPVNRSGHSENNWAVR